MVGKHDEDAAGSTTTNPSSTSSTSSTSLASSASIDARAKSYPHWHDMIAGAASGLGARGLTAPLDLLKIRRQLQQQSIHDGTEKQEGDRRRIGSSSNRITRGMIHHAKEEWKIIHQLHAIARREGGFQSLFRGNVAASYLWMGYSVVQFWLYGVASDYLTQMTSSSSSSPSIHAGIISFASGAASGICATLVTYPLDLCRTVFAARGLFPVSASNVTWSTNTALQLLSHEVGHRRHPPKTLLGFARQIYRQNQQHHQQATHGFWRNRVLPFRIFYAGSTPALLQIVPYMGLNFALHDYFFRLLQRAAEQIHATGSHSIVHNTDHAKTTTTTTKGTATTTASATFSGMAGMAAGVLSKFLVYPLDTVKKRLQAQAFWGGSSSSTSILFSSPLSSSSEAASPSAPSSSSKLSLPHRVHYHGMLDCFQTIARTEGTAAFYKGLIPSLLKSSVSTGASFWIFTLTRNILRSIHDSQQHSFG